MKGIETGIGLATQFRHLKTGGAAVAEIIHLHTATTAERSAVGIESADTLEVELYFGYGDIGGYGDLLNTVVGRRREHQLRSIVDGGEYLGVLFVDEEEIHQTHVFEVAFEVCDTVCDRCIVVIGGIYVSRYGEPAVDIGPVALSHGVGLPSRIGVGYGLAQFRYYGCDGNETHARTAHTALQRFTQIAGHKVALYERIAHDSYTHHPAVALRHSRTEGIQSRSVRRVILYGDYSITYTGRCRSISRTFGRH